MVVLVDCPDDIIDVEARMILPSAGLLDKQRGKERGIERTDLEALRFIVLLCYPSHDAGLGMWRLRLWLADDGPQFRVLRK
jgi:hypothetical protein